DLELCDPVFHRRAVNSRPPHAITEKQIQFVRDLRREVVDVGVPLAVEGGGEEQLRVVVQKYEAHIVDSANPVRVVEVSFPQPQQTAESLRSAFRERGDDSQL